MTIKAKKTILLENEKMLQFPDLIFYEAGDGCIYFDATFYLSANPASQSCSTEGFRKTFAAWIKPIQRAYGIAEEDLIIRDANTGHHLIDESLSLLFVAYTDENYRVSFIERISEMEIMGIALSDSRLIDVITHRFTKEQMNKIMMDYGEK